MKKNILRNILPIAAAILLVTSCSKDGDSTDNNVVINPEQPTPEQPAEEVSGKYVKVPFSVKVDNGESLSKISYTQEGTKVKREFEDADLPDGTNPIPELVLTCATDGVIASNSKLTLTKSDGHFYFEGDIEVASELVENFNGGAYTLTGEFSTTASAPKESSTESLADLMRNCNHTYQSKPFKSDGTEDISLVDQCAYLAVTWTNGGGKTVNISIGGTPTDFTLNSSGQVWIAVPKDVKITSGNLGISSDAERTTQVGHIYKIEKIAATSVTLNKNSLSLSIGGEEMLTATVAPDNRTVDGVEWSSSSPSVATVDEDGNVTAVAEGTATIKATAKDGSGVYGECYVRVEFDAAATSIRNLHEIQGSGKYILEQDIEVDNFFIEQYSNIDIDLNGHTITTTMDVINVDNATLTLRGSGTIDCAIETWTPDPEEDPSYTEEERHDAFSLYGNAVLNLYGDVTIINADFGVRLNENSVLNICDNVTITNDKFGVFVSETSGKINMYGGTITGCQVGVFAFGSGQDVLNNQGGTISGNEEDIY